VGGPQPAGDDEQVAVQAALERRGELGRVVADDPQLGRLDPEREKRARQVRPVEVTAVAADELRPRDDESRAQAGQSECTPLGVTVSAAGL